jgi:glycosyltransferase involved in cell wall biosynthesis
MLVEMGHEVTLFASGDSITRAHLSAQTPRSLRLDSECVDQTAHHILMVERVFQQAAEFDIIHSHIDYFPFSLARLSSTPTVTTLHGRLDIKDLSPLYREFSELPLVSISDAQRRPLPRVRWVGTVYHGLPRDLYTMNGSPGPYLGFVGRISPEKRVETAIEIAKRAELPLKIAAKVDKADAEFFREVVRPLLDHPLIEYIGEISEKEKNDFIGQALALLAPIDWPEPFGLVFIEAMACGTPVITRPRGSAPELIEEGVTGFIVDSIEEAVNAVRRIPDIDRQRCREVFERRFTSARMAQDYLEIYSRLMDDSILSRTATDVMGVDRTPAPPIAPVHSG